MVKELGKTHVIAFPMSSWWEWLEGRRNRNYFLFEQMRRDANIEKIIIIEPPALTWKRAIKNLLAWKQYSKKYSCVKSGLLYSIWQVDEKVFLVSLLWKIPINNIQYAKVVPVVLNQCGRGAVRMVWSWNPFIDAQWLKKLFPSTVMIFDAVDDWSAHPVYARVKKMLKQRYTKIAKMYDVIFTVSEELKERYFSGHTRVYDIPNGVDFHRFEQARKESIKIKMPQVVYVGVIQERFDIGLVEKCATAFPDVRFFIAGPVWKGVDLSPLVRYENIVLKGPIAYDMVPFLLAQSWVGIVPHIVDAFTQSMDPMKVYEYLAGGIPVVSTAVVSVNPSASMVDIAQTHEEFVLCLQKRLDQARGVGRDDECVSREYDWSKKYKKMIDFIAPLT